MTRPTCPPCTGRCRQGRACPGNAWAPTQIEGEENNAPEWSLLSAAAELGLRLLWVACGATSVVAGLLAARLFMGAA